jgi:hypothetical protein
MYAILFIATSFEQNINFTLKGFYSPLLEGCLR